MFLYRNVLAIQCQVINHRTSVQVTCTEREARWRCEVIGPHDRHVVGAHTMVHESMGNGYHCSAIEMRLKSERAAAAAAGKRAWFDGPGWKDQS